MIYYAISSRGINRYGGDNMNKPGSLRAAGFATIAVDKPTRAGLKVLAGDMPLAHYLRGIAFGTIKPPEGNAQSPLPGQERAVSPATIHAVAAGISELRANTVTRADYNTLELMISDIANALGIKVIDTGLRAKLKELARSRSEQLPMVEQLG